MPTFRELYDDELAKPSPSAAFISRVAEETCVADNTVRQWLSKGGPVPNRLTQAVLSRLFGIPAEELFPPGVKERQ